MNPHIQTKGALAHSPTARVSNWYPKVQENFKASWRVQPQSPDNLPAAYSPLSEILPIYQHGKVTPLKLEKNYFQLDQWDDLTHHIPIQLVLPKTETKSQQCTVPGTPLLKFQAVLKPHLKTYLLLSQRSLGRPPIFPSVSLYLNFPTVQCFPPHGDTLRGSTEGLRPFVLTLHKRVQTLEQIEKYKLMPETKNFCSSWRICGKSCTVLPSATVLMSVREHKSEWKNSSSSTLYRHLTWLGGLSLCRIGKQICSLDSLFSAFLEFKVSFYCSSTDFDDCCVHICSQINKSVHLHMLSYGKGSKTKTCPTPYTEALLYQVRYYQVRYDQILSGSLYLH